MDSDPIGIASDRLSATISPLGAELWSLSDVDGRELMTDADPAFWTGHAPLLFPIVGTLNGDRYRLNGQEFSLPRHGFARRRTFAIIKHGAADILFQLEADDETRAAYPFDFRLDMAFAIEGATLSMTATVANLGQTDMPFSLGYHPAFAWPLPYGAPAQDHHILFEQAEPAPLRQLDANGLVMPALRPTPVEDRTLGPTPALFADDALIWDDLNSRSLIWGAPGHPALRIDFPDTAMLGLWQKPGAHYLCIEPWAGIADPAGFGGEIWDKPGIERLPPGESRSIRMSVTLTPAFEMLRL